MSACGHARSQAACSSCRLAFPCGHPRDIWNTFVRTSEGRSVQRCRECAKAQERRWIASGKDTERQRRRSAARGTSRPNLWRADPHPSPCPDCGLVRIPPRVHKCDARFECNWNGILCPACGLFKGERRMKEALCVEHGSIGMLYYRRDPEYRQGIIDRAKHRDHLKRAAMERGELITLAALIERDGDCCYLCGRQVSNALPFTHPLKANIDHVVPVSKGGAHTLGNVRVACRSCNSAKGARLVA
jgi:hypothetical protein